VGGRLVELRKTYLTHCARPPTVLVGRRYGCVRRVASVTCTRCPSISHQDAHSGVCCCNALGGFHRWPPHVGWCLSWNAGGSWSEHLMNNLQRHLHQLPAAQVQALTTWLCYWHVSRDTRQYTYWRAQGSGSALGLCVWTGLYWCSRSGSLGMAVAVGAKLANIDRYCQFGATWCR